MKEITACAHDPSRSHPRALKSLLIALGFLFYQRAQACDRNTEVSNALFWPLSPLSQSLKEEESVALWKADTCLVKNNAINFAFQLFHLP